MARVDSDGKVSVSAPCEDILRVIYKTAMEEAKQRQVERARQLAIQTTVDRIIKAQNDQIAIYKKALDGAEAHFREIRRILESKPK
jgi:hypothetical protein